MISPFGTFPTERLREEARETATSVLEGYRQGFESSVSERFEAVQTAVAALREEYEELASSLERTADGSAAATRFLAHEFRSYLWLVSAGADVAEARIQR